MEDKRLREEELKRKAAEEEAKEDRRIAEQQARIAREYEEEIRQRKGTSTRQITVLLLHYRYTCSSRILVQWFLIY